MQIRKLEENITVYDNFISPQEINILLEYAKKSADSDWQEVTYHNEEMLKKSKTVYEKYQKFKKDWDKTTLLAKNIDILENIKLKVEKTLGISFLVTDDIYRIKKFENGRSIGVHFDNLQNAILELGIVIYLNDDFDGGEIYYPSLNIEYKPKAGSMIVHPANKLYSHGVKEVFGNTRYCLAFFAIKINIL